MDRNGPFVDRPVPIGLFELLYRREGGERPLPVVVVTGPGGGGKTRLLDYLYARAKEPLTCARVRVTPENGPVSLRDLLHAVREELSTDRHPQCGLIPFPRYELAHWMCGVARELGPHPDAEGLRSCLKELLNRRYRAPADAGQAAQNIFVVLFQWLIELILPAFLTRPSIIRRILWGRHRETGFTWFERHQRYVDLPENRRFDDVVRKVCSLSAAGHADAPDEARAMDALLLSALLDDVSAAFDPRQSRSARLRTTHCVVLVDDLDRLPDGQGLQLLELLAERWSDSERTDPLLLLVTGQRRGIVREAAARLNGSSDDPGQPAASGIGSDQVDPQKAAETLYAAWRASLDQPRDQGMRLTPRFLLPVELPPLSREETRLLVTRWPGARLRQDGIVADELYQVTRGHPLAAGLLLRALDGDRPDTVLPGMRRLLAEPVPADVLDAQAGESIDAYLLRRFLEPVEDRLEPALLAACAAPRRLDLPTLLAALDLPSDDAGWSRARDVWDELADCAFASVDDDNLLAVHPLLRDVLARELATRADEGSLSYFQVHSRLAGYFAAVARTRPEAIVDHAYHEAALEHPQLALHQLDRLAEEGQPAWREALLAVAAAPWPLHRPTSSNLFDLPTRIRSRWPGRASTALPMLECARALYSPTSDERWTAGLLEETRELRSPQGTARDASAVSSGSRGSGRDRPPSRGVIRDDEDLPFPSPRRRSYRGVRRVGALAAVLALVLAYSGLYAAYATEACHAAGPLEVSSVLSDRLADNGIHVRHAEARGRGQCIGVTEGRFVFDPQVRTVQEHIAAENAWVMGQANATGRPYVTAVVMDTFTPRTSDGANEQVAAGRATLQGIYLAQRDYNRAGYVPMLRVLVANAGASSQYAVEVAHQIVTAAERDSTIVAVLGLGQSRATTPRAVDILGSAGLPMVASFASDDRLRERSDHFYRVAAPNRRQAEVAALYAKRRLGLTSAIVISDTRDAYSENLAADFVAAFTDPRHTLVYPERLVYDAERPDVANTLSDLAQQACFVHPDLIYFAGRAREMTMLLSGIRNAPCDRPVTIMSGHDVTQLQSTAPPTPGLKLRVPLYYTAPASPAAWRPERQPPFYRAYYNYIADTRGVGGPAGAPPPPNGHAVLAYDAARVVTQALTRLPAPAEADSFAMWRAIEGTTGVNAVSGASGTIDLGDQLDGDPRDKAVALLRLTGLGEPATLVGTCGRVSGDRHDLAKPPGSIPCPSP